MSVSLPDVVRYLDQTLEVSRFRDYGTNGLQIEGASQVQTIVTGVSANMALFEKAAALDADLIVVHHGLFWGGLKSLTGSAAKRFRYILERNISLAAYHLPLDKHGRLGNNAGLCDAISLGESRGEFGDVRGHALGTSGSWPEPLSIEEAVSRISKGVLGNNHVPFVFAHGPEKVQKVGVCTGAASDLLEAAADHGCDLFLTGELAERASEVAREMGIHLVAAGHYATEVFGPQRLATELTGVFPAAKVEFVDVPCSL